MNTRPDFAPALPSAGDYLIASKTCELKSLQYFLQMGRLVQCISNLVHGLQRERGASNVFLGSSGQKFAGERHDLMVESDRLKTQFGRALAEKWFTLMTERIDGLKKVEESVERCFHSRCVERFADARNSLAHQEALIASLDARKMTQPPMLVVCESLNEANAARAGNTENPESPETAAGAFSASGIGQHFGRSVFDLVQEQTRRLQQMSSELQSAREALEDRKVQEKAVLLLMEHRRINNDEAHRALRKLAMDQGRKLPEVARALLAMASVLK